MKKLSFKLMILLMGVLAISVFASCSDDNNDEQISETNIVGKWTLEKTTVDGVTEIFTDEDCTTQRDYFEYLSTGTLKTVSYDSDCKKHSNSEQTWSLSESTLTESDNYYKEVYTVKELNSTTLILHYDKSYENGKEREIIWDNDDNDGGDDVTIYMKKLN